MAWTRERVRDELREAMDIIKGAPDPVKALLKAQPVRHVVHDPNESFGYDDLEKKLPPTERDLEWAQERARWMRWLDADTCKLVRLRAANVPWKIITKRDVPKRRKRGTLSNLVNKGLDKIVWRLNTIEQHRKK